MVCSAAAAANAHHGAPAAAFANWPQRPASTTTSTPTAANVPTAVSGPRLRSASAFKRRPALTRDLVDPSAESRSRPSPLDLRRSNDASPLCSTQSPPRGHQNVPSPHRETARRVFNRPARPRSGGAPIVPGAQALSPTCARSGGPAVHRASGGCARRLRAWLLSPSWGPTTPRIGPRSASRWRVSVPSSRLSGRPTRSSVRRRLDAKRRTLVTRTPGQPANAR